MNIGDTDPATINRLVDFLYRGDYYPRVICVQDRRGAWSIRGFQTASLNDIRAATVSTETGPRPPSWKAVPTEDNAELLLCHVRVCAIADYLNLPDLLTLANWKIRVMFGMYWRVDWFVPFVELFSEKCNRDLVLQDTASSLAAIHMSELVDRHDWKNIRATGSFHNEVYTKMLKQKNRVCKDPWLSYERHFDIEQEQTTLTDGVAEESEVD